MTQAVNLANFANNLDTSGGVNPSALNAAVPVSKGGTGDVTASGARTNLGLVIGTNVPSPTGTGASGTWGINITGNAATATSATTAANGGVTSVNGLTGAVTVSGGVTSFAGQTGAVDPTVLGNIGSVMQVFVNTTSTSLPNTTIAGSNLYYPSAISSANTTLITYNSGGFQSLVQIIDTSTYGVFCVLKYTDTRAGNTGFTTPRGASTLSGTWRLLTPVVARLSAYDSCANFTTSFMYAAFAVRIS
jgi:hypothetical protein